MYKGDKYEIWLKEMLIKKSGNADLTFMELHQLKLKNKNYKDLFLYRNKYQQAAAGSFLL